MDKPHSLHISLLMDTACFCVLPIVSNAVISMGVHESFQYPVFISSG